MTEVSDRSTGQPVPGRIGYERPIARARYLTSVTSPVCAEFCCTPDGVCGPAELRQVLIDLAAGPEGPQTGRSAGW